MESIFKYMAFWKFDDLLKREQLYFRRIDKFKDANEGRKTQPSIGLLPDNASEFQKEKQIVELWEKIDEIGLKHYFISCWNVNEEENLDLWIEYGEQNDAIAILTDESRLHGCIKKSFVEFGRADYTRDYEKDFNHDSNPGRRCFQKDSSFRDENELRALFFDYTPNSAIDYEHVYIDIDLDLLVKNIIISPYASLSFENMVCEYMKQYGKEFLIERLMKSKLNPPPRRERADGQHILQQREP